ncbi:YolD-like family protein [Psychrobacillus sp. FJAT-51614]|uniref:YolD-like family protein n=1 Tax=Psychrobacillus mangrovi TaxID=3117745 RepID=A0ABU8F7H1_9BACI
MMREDHFDHELDLSKVQDRGSKKWVAMVLPEHVKLMRDYVREQQLIPRPQLNEWDLEIIEETINLAMTRKCDVAIKMWRDGKYVLRGGIIQRVDLKQRTMEVDDPFGLHKYKLDEVVDVTVLE